MSDIELIEATLGEVVKGKAPGVGVQLRQDRLFNTTVLRVGLQVAGDHSFAGESLAAMPESARLDALSHTTLSMVDDIRLKAVRALGLPKVTEHEVWRQNEPFRGDLNTFTNLSFDVRDDGSAVISYDDLKKILHESGHWKTGMGRKY